jgi:hypothetical protein
MTARILTLLAALAASAAALPQDLRPANFDVEDEDRQMRRLLGFPDVSGDVEVQLNCFSLVQESGKMKDTNCYMAKNYDEPFVLAVTTAAKKARMNPALIDGEPREVYLQFMVKFVQKEEDRQIMYVLNPGYEENVNAYGIDHISGQRAIGKREPWNAACPRRARYLVLVRSYLGEDGRADNVSIEHADGIVPTASCQDAIRQTILQSRFTPAYVDGEPVPSTYFEPFGN